MTSRKLELELEKRIIDTMINCLFAANLLIEIAIDDEEKETFITGTDKEKLMDEIFSVEECVLYIYDNKESKKCRFISLYPGNVQDIISYWSISLDGIIEPAIKLAESYD